MGGSVRLDAVVYGRVQGVGYRAFARRTAEAYGITGWARNRPDGSVSVCAVGSRLVLDMFLKALNEGPLRARVTGIDATWGGPTGEEPTVFRVG